MAHALGMSRSDMLLKAMRDPAPEAFAALVERRAAHEPVAYITGEAEFYGLTLRVTPATLIPRGDSETLVEAALDQLLPYCQEFWSPSPQEAAAQANGTGIDMAALQADWNQIVDAALQEATLKRPADGGFVPTGKQGVHSEHLGFVLAEMQSLARAHPEATW